MATTASAPIAQAGEFVATEIAWWGCCSEALVADKLAKAGHNVAAADVLAFAVEAGLVRQSVIGYSASRKTNAKVFGRKFADWMVA
jgi:hypothetical protein